MTEDHGYPGNKKKWLGNSPQMQFRFLKHIDNN